MSTPEPVMKCSSIWLKYRMNNDSQKSLKSLLVNVLKRKRNIDEFWGLKDITFTLNQGETVGILGPNGSGKSSLVKVLSGIFRPDEGKIMIQGKIAALLEVGAGFQRDLTGRENIFLNGSILGLSQVEIKDKFDEIVSFAELSEFIDTPVRHYSSGMYARLGFSIAAHINPDFLLIDEVLSVGDQLFQKKCYEKINEFKQKNKTIILISHNLAALTELCNRCIWMETGEIVMDDSTHQVINAYVKHNFEKQENRYREESRRMNTNRLNQSKKQSAQILNVKLLNSKGDETHTVHTGENISIEILFHAFNRTEKPVFGIAFQKRDGTLLAGPNSLFDDYEISAIDGKGKITYKLPEFPLLSGTYTLSASLYDNKLEFAYDYLDKIYPFQVLEGSTKQKHGFIYLGGSWSINNE